MLMKRFQEIHKQHPSAFTGTGLDEQLKELGKSKIVLVGYMVSLA